MKKNKILYIIPTLYGAGAEKIVTDLSIFIDKNKFDVSVVCLKKSGVWEEKLKENKIPLIILSSGKLPIVFYFFKLVKIIKNISPDIVHTHLFGGDFYGRLAAFLAGVKHIVSTEHNLNFSEGFIRLFLKKITARFSEKIIAVSEAVKQYLIKKEGILADKIQVIYNGVAINDFLQKKESYKTKKESFIIGSIGRLHKQKGFDLLIEAVSKIDDVKCLIAGDGVEKKNLEEQINKLDVKDKVELVWWKKNILEFLNSLDAFVLPSRWEGFGIVILEAGLIGLPIIGSNVDGIVEIIDDNENGLLFKNGDVDDLIAKILVLKKSEENRMRLGKNIEKKIIEKFDIKKITKEYEELYSKILA